MAHRSSVSPRASYTLQGKVQAFKDLQDGKTGNKNQEKMGKVWTTQGVQAKTPTKKKDKAIAQKKEEKEKEKKTKKKIKKTS